MDVQPAVSNDPHGENDHPQSDRKPVEPQSINTRPDGESNREAREARARKFAMAGRPETGDLKGHRRSLDSPTPPSPTAFATKPAAVPSRAASVGTQSAPSPSSSTPKPTSAATSNKKPTAIVHPAPTPAQSAEHPAQTAAAVSAPMAPEAEAKANEEYEEYEEEEEAEPVRVGTDTGFAWVILFASFVCNFLVDGIAFSYGVFMNDVEAEFKAPKYVVALAGSLCVGVYLLVGPVVSALYNHLGCRYVTMGGSILTTIAFALAYFSGNIYFFIVSFGILGGAGFGCVYLPAVVVVGHWFEKRRAFATGVAVCGSSLGSFFIAPLCSTLVRYFGWRGTVLILGGLVLNCFWAGALFRPVRLRYPDEEEAEEEEEDDEAEENAGGESDAKADRDSTRKNGTADGKPAPSPPTPNNGIEYIEQQKIAAVADSEKENSTSATDVAFVIAASDELKKRKEDVKQDVMPPFKRSESNPVDEKKEPTQASPTSVTQTTINVRKVSVRAKSAAATGAGGRQYKDVISSEGELHIVDAPTLKLETVPEDEPDDSGAAQKPLVPRHYTKHVVSGPKRRIFSESAEMEATTATKSLSTLAMGGARYRPRSRTEIGQRIIQIRPRTGTGASGANEALTPLQMERVRDEIRLFSGTLVGMSTFTSSHDGRWRGSRSTLDQRDPADPTRSRDRLFSSSSLFVSSQMMLARKRASHEAAQLRRGSAARDGAAASGELSPTAATTVAVEAEEEERRAVQELVLEGVKDFLRTTFDMSLLTSPTFILVLVSSFFSMMGFLIPFMFVVPYATKASVALPEFLAWLLGSEGEANMKFAADLLLMTINFCNAFGRVVSGRVSDIKQVDCLWLNNVALVIAGAATIDIPYLSSFYALTALLVVFGLCIATFVTLRSIIMIELFGIQKLSSAFGLLILVQGVAMISGSPIAGWLYEITESYKSTFWFSGGIIAFSGLLCFPMRALKGWEARRETARLRARRASQTTRKVSRAAIANANQSTQNQNQSQSTPKCSDSNSNSTTHNKRDVSSNGPSKPNGERKQSRTAPAADSGRRSGQPTASGATDDKGGGDTDRSVSRQNNEPKAKPETKFEGPRARGAPSRASESPV